MDNFYMDDYYSGPGMPKQNKFATASFALGMCSLVLLCTLFLPIPLGALGILFYCLSRRKGRPADSPAKAGLVTSLIGLIFGTVCMVFTLYSAISMLKPENKDLLNQQFESVYGMDFDEYMNHIYGEDYEDMYRNLFGNEMED